LHRAPSGPWTLVPAASGSPISGSPNTAGLATAYGTDIDTQTPPPPDPAALKNLVMLASIVAALAVLALTVGLVRAETARDLSSSRQRWSWSWSRRRSPRRWRRSR
jgi:hypothetical protein